MECSLFPNGFHSGTIQPGKMSHFPIHIPTPPTSPPLSYPVPTRLTYPQETFPSPHHPSHAIYTTSSPSSNILLRTINNGLTLSLSSLSLSISSPSHVRLKQPIRLHFPEPLHSSPVLFSHPAGSVLWVLALTKRGVLIRLALPSSGLKWDEALRRDGAVEEIDLTDWLRGRQPGVFWAVDENVGMVGLSEGAILKIERDDDEWTSTELKPTSYLSSITSLLPSFSSRPSGASHLQPNEIIALSSYSQEDTLNLTFSLSRDRKLRIWNVLTGVCARTVDLSVANGVGAESGGLITEGGNGTEGPRSFIKVVSRKPTSSSSSPVSSSFQHNNEMEIVSSNTWKSTFYLVVYLPPSSTTISSSSSPSSAAGNAFISPGRFVTYRVVVDTHKGTISEPSFSGVRIASPPSSFEGGSLGSAVAGGGVELRDFEVLLGGKSGARSRKDTIWAVWDLKGRTVIQSSSLDGLLSSSTGSSESDWEDIEGSNGGWETLRDVVEPNTGFTVDYFEDLLSSVGAYGSSDRALTRESVAEIFINHLFAPSRFAPTSLQSALESYIQTIQSLPSTTHNAALSQSYPSLSSRVDSIVGSHLAPLVSPQTGEIMHADYIRKLKIEWLGFLARVVEGERDARWGVGIVKMGASGGDESGNTAEEEGVVVIERDGLVLPVEGGKGESLALRIVNGGGHLNGATDEDDVVAFSKIGWSVVERLPPSAKIGLEGEFDQLVATGVNCPIEDTCLDIFEAKLASYISDDMSSSTSREISSLFLDSGLGENRDITTLVTLALNQVRELENGVESGLALSPLGIAFLDESLRVSLEWRFSLVFNLLIGLILVLDQVTSDREVEKEGEDQLRDSLPLAILSTLGVYQKLSALRWLSRTISLDNSGANDSFGGDLGLLERFDSLHVNHPSSSLASHSSSNTLPLPSLLLALLRSVPTSIALPSTSTLTSISSCTASFLQTTSLPFCPAERENMWAVQPQDGKLALALLEAGHPEHAVEFGERFMKDEGLAFVEAKARLVLGQVEESEALFEQLSGAFDGRPAISVSPTLSALLPSKISQPVDLVEFYRLVILFYEATSLDASIVKFANLAIEATHSDSVKPSSSRPKNTLDFWSKLFKSTVALGRFEDAHMILTTTPYRESISDAVSHLVTVMCHANEVDRLTHFTFVGLEDIVERTLAFKARHSDPLVFPNYLLVLYSWHIRRGDYRAAASAMYQQGRRFGEINGRFVDIGPRRAKSYLLAINALSLVDQKQAWLAVPLSADSGNKRRKRRKLTSYIPEETFSPSARTKDVEIVELEDIRREYNLVLSTLLLAERFPDSFQSNTLAAEDAIALFVQAGMFDTAFLHARQLQVDLTGIFERLAIKTVEAAHSAAHARVLGIPESLDHLDWLIDSPTVTSLDGPISGRASQYLRIMLERHDGPATFFKYRQAVLEKLLDCDRFFPIPSFLVEFFSVNDPERLIQSYLTYDLLKEALEHSIALIRRAPSIDVLPKQANATYVPYNILNVVLRESSTSKSEQVKSLAEELKREVDRRLGDLESVRMG
ncbi:Nuclear pore complex, Nup160 component [Phaffia rhodozyma]|uniref:Nuclear pore complex, Nup160 component n=1 Tax=Phaffia rhodozyma TaxID=264483 RepID=A0A0F7SPK8_PHARH|nr:Nuclear pore complex, Nup160 component [Phaffia rhodozyma]